MPKHRGKCKRHKDEGAKKKKGRQKELGGGEPKEYDQRVKKMHKK